MMRITAFIGAGAAIELGGPTTDLITQAVRNRKQGFFDKKIQFIDRVAKVLDNYYGSPCNFEEIFHTLELLHSYKTGLYPSTVKMFKPPIGAFTKPRLTRFFKQTDEPWLSFAKSDLIQTVGEVVNQYDSGYATNIDVAWHKNFWQKATSSNRWDIATLNYDTCIEQSLNNYEDGFVATSYNFKRFNPAILFKTKKTRIMHLHGSINYGFGRTTDNPNEYALEDDFNDIHKFRSFEEANGSWTGRSTNTAQSREEAVIGPLITGMRKTDKVITYPYSSYYSELQNAIIKNERLLVIGYSFGDLHFNKILERIPRIHGSKRKIVVITYFNKPVWHPVWTAMGWPENRDMFIFISKAFQEFYPFPRTFTFTHPLISPDGKARIYLKGFKDAVENHGNEILEFLTT